MLMLLSPAKSLHEGPAVAEYGASQPAMQTETETLLDTVRTLSSKELQDLMHISEKLGDLNAERYQSLAFPFDRDNAKQAALLFAGDTYRGLDAASLSPEDLAWAQDHVGILSGLYGVVRPLDLIQPYRLEMGTKLATGRGKDLYSFWGDRIAQQLAQWRGDDATIVNCASNEYFGAVKSHLGGRVITPVFKDEKGGKARVLSFFAKQARGAMVRWAIKNRVTDAEHLKQCDAMGYTFRPELSTDDQWAFHRTQPPPAGSR
ncbi:MAG: peroxide stress protein YaaA [Deltaproteobacteria bacterium]|nr:MAG: peroxide stress protein YaaA [Deltaproteobacteria bacterium]